MDFKETISTLLPKQTTIEWVLCSPHFDDIILIAPEGLEDTPPDQNYQEILSKQIKIECFSHAHFQVKRQYLFFLIFGAEKCVINS